MHLSNSSPSPELIPLEEGDFGVLFFVWVFVLHYIKDLGGSSRGDRKWETVREYLPRMTGRLYFKGEKVVGNHDSSRRYLSYVIK